MQGENERGYHIFYQMLAGLSAEEKKELKLGDVNMYKCVTKGNCTVIDGVDDVKEFEETRV